MSSPLLLKTTQSSHPVAAEVFGAHLLCHSGVLAADCPATRCSCWQFAIFTAVNLRT